MIQKNSEKSRGSLGPEGAPTTVLKIKNLVIIWILIGHSFPKFVDSVYSLCFQDIFYNQSGAVQHNKAQIKINVQIVLEVMLFKSEA